MQPKEWIDRYVNEVGERIPARQRADVEMEIRSLIEDELEAAGQTDETAVFAALHNFGPPDEMAAHYRPPRYLIGPALFPTFLTVLRIVLLVLIGVSLFAAAVEVGVNNGGWPSPLEFVADLLNGLIQGAGWVVLVFALIEYFTRGKGLEEKKSWDPRSLPKVENADRVNRGEAVAAIVFLTIGLALFNLMPGWLGNIVLNGADGGELLVTELLRTYILWLSTLWALTIGFNAYLLVNGRHTALSRWLELGLSVAGLALLGLMLAGEPLSPNPGLDTGIKLALAVTFAVVAVLDVGQQVRNLIQRRRTVQSAAGASTGPAHS